MYIAALMKGLEFLLFNMESMMKRISDTSKADSTLEKLKADSVRDDSTLMTWNGLVEIRIDDVYCVGSTVPPILD